MTIVPSRKIRMEAAAWFARLHADDCRTAGEERFRAWLNASPNHLVALKAVSRSWDAVGRVQIDPDGVIALPRGSALPNCKT